MARPDRELRMTPSDQLPADQLSAEELERYARHIVLRDVGGAGQQTLRNAKVLVVGAGGLGSPALLYLAAAGIGTVGIIDDDQVSISNLQRQIVHNSNTVGDKKVASAAAAIEKLNPFVKVEQHPMRLDANNALEIVGNYDLVAEGTDNFATRYLLNDACYLAKKPLVSAAVGQFDGAVTTIRAFESDKDGNPNPTYRCLFPAAPPREMAPACEDAGILGVVPGIIGSIQAMEVIKELLGIGTSLVGRLLTYDARDARTLDVRYKWDPNNPLNGTNPTIRDLSGHEAG